MKKIVVGLASLFAIAFGTLAYGQVPGMFQPLLIGGTTPIGTPTSLGSTTSASGNSVTCTITTTANLTAGNLLAVAVQIPSNTLQTVSGVVAGTNVLSVAVAQNDGANYNNEIWYIGNAAFLASGSSIVVTFSAITTGGNGYGCEAMQTSGIIKASPLDKTATQNTTTASPTVTTAALSQANEIAFGSSFQGGGPNTYTEASGFTNLFNVNPGSLNRAGLGYKITTATTAVTYAPTFSGSRTTETVIATFKGF